MKFFLSVSAVLFVVVCVESLTLDEGSKLVTEGCGFIAKDLQKANSLIKCILDKKGQKYPVDDVLSCLSPGQSASDLLFNYCVKDILPDAKVVKCIESKKGIDLLASVTLADVEEARKKCLMA